MGVFYVYIFIQKKESKKSATEFINTLKKPVIVRDISKQFKGQNSFTTKVHYMLIEDGDKKLYYLTNDEYELRPFIQYVINENIIK
ncbi:MAG: hypothetical protein [Bacteriophage sp.]|nr:MAG: hypothetical protein [Bacteriophage sp.]UWG15439.1 MAG: hypothetical protein [Bacteriophage sp.]UWI34489.1 MAG: hypothetical protein [Bacteriophage sp.]